jgi:hypothetical protein
MLGGEVVQFGAILGDVVELPRLAPEADDLPVAVAQPAILGKQKMDRWPRPRLAARAVTRMSVGFKVVLSSLK